LRRVLERYPIPDSAVWRTTVTPSAFHSGDAHNRVPADALLKLDIRRVPEDDSDAIMAFLRTCFPGAEVTAQQCGSTLKTASDDPYVQRLAAAYAAVTGKPVGFRGEHFGSDARFYSEAGVPAVCFGPHGAGLHSHEEWVSIDSLETLYRVLERLITTGS
jgi:succinyl-diaminopimelate desuccinylase